VTTRYTKHDVASGLDRENVRREGVLTAGPGSQLDVRRIGE